MNAAEPNSNTVAPAGAASPPSFADRKFRQKLRDELRAEEWAMHRELLAAARIILKNFYENPHKSTVADVARIIDLSSKLGRLATESDSGFTSNEVDTAAVIIEFKAALTKVTRAASPRAVRSPPARSSMWNQLQREMILSHETPVASIRSATRGSAAGTRLFPRPATALSLQLSTINPQPTPP